MTTSVDRDDRELIEIEEAAWRALATSGEAASEYYAHRLASEVVILMPGGMVIDDRDRVIESMQGPPWDEFDLSDVRVLPIGTDGAALTYRIDARRGDQDYAALLNSTYRREDGEWRLALHQQTPV
jgi:hypothetical protein